MGKGDNPRWRQVDQVTYDKNWAAAFNSEGKIRAKVAQIDKDRTDEQEMCIQCRERPKIGNVEYCHDCSVDKKEIRLDKTCGSCGHSHVITWFCTIKNKEVGHLGYCDKWTRSYGTAEMKNYAV